MLFINSLQQNTPIKITRFFVAPRVVLCALCQIQAEPLLSGGSMRAFGARAAFNA